MLTDQENISISSTDYDHNHDIDLSSQPDSSSDYSSSESSSSNSEMGINSSQKFGRNQGSTKQIGVTVDSSLARSTRARTNTLVQYLTSTYVMEVDNEL